jgi:hypothetical protein
MQQDSTISQVWLDNMSLGLPWAARVRDGAIQCRSSMA